MSYSYSMHKRYQIKNSKKTHTPQEQPHFHAYNLFYMLKDDILFADGFLQPVNAVR